MNEVKLMGTLKSVKMGSKLDSNNQPLHTVDLRIELSEGEGKVRELVEMLRAVVEMTVVNKQPTLEI